MIITEKSKINEPLETPNGEIIYELVGNACEAKCEGHSLAHVVIPVGKASVNHYHPVAEETYHMLKGKGRLILDGEEAEITAGQTVFIAPGQHHKIFSVGEEALEMLCVCVPAWEPTNTVWLE